METFESALLPVLPLKDHVLFPSAVSPLFVVRPGSLHSLEIALKGDKRLFLVCQRALDVENPGKKDLHEVGTVAEILQVLRVPDGSAKILVEGLYAARCVDLMSGGDGQRALLVRQEVAGMDAKSAEAAMRTARKLFASFTESTDKVPEDLATSIQELDEPLALAHAISNYSPIKTSEKQRILEAGSIEEKFMLLNANLEKELQIIDLEEQIVTQVKSSIGRSQREFFLNEQLKAIEKELGIGEGDNPEVEELRRAVEGAGMPAHARSRAAKELERLGRMAPMSPEATVVRGYIEWLAEVPWNKATEDRIDLREARRILDGDHFGLEKIKERIIEYLAVAKLAGNSRGPLLCLVGPPGVGKTSLARSVARCIGREFVRISLGGVRDEAEIRGHRRTYIGALPGKIVQSMKKAGTVNPVFLMDEIDKMSADFRGDPAAALLEVLDPEQNKTFADHYLEVDYDLSRVLFLCTANTTAGIPLPLQDRLEVIRLAGYTEAEKLEIARRYLLPRALKSHGLRRQDVPLDKKALLFLIQGYTKEAGVRGLEREVNALCRKVACRVVAAQEKGETHTPKKITDAVIRELLGPERFRDAESSRQPEEGTAVGMAWTEVGGELLHVEVKTMPGKGELHLTGTLGDVMKESARTALSIIRAHAQQLGLDPEFHRTTDVHIHLPEGAIPKDGPSAGITLATALVSALSGRMARQDVAMTGEVTLRGRVLRIGGLKEKVLAAHRNRIREVIIPADNAMELEEIPEDVRRRMTFHTVKHLHEVFDLVLAPAPAGKVRRRGKPAGPTLGTFFAGAEARRRDDGTDA